VRRRNQPSNENGGKTAAISYTAHPFRSVGVRGGDPRSFKLNRYGIPLVFPVEVTEHRNGDKQGANDKATHGVFLSASIRVADAADPWNFPGR
jgi:hypothetical protein